MKTNQVVEEKCQNCCNNYHSNTSHNNVVYGLGLAGAALYFMPQATNLTEFLLAFGKSIVWPAMLVYHALQLLKL